MGPDNVRFVTRHEEAPFRDPINDTLDVAEQVGVSRLVDSISGGVSRLTSRKAVGSMSITTLTRDQTLARQVTHPLPRVPAERTEPSRGRPAAAPDEPRRHRYDLRTWPPPALAVDRYVNWYRWFLPQ